MALISSLVSISILVLAVITSGHALLSKRDPKAALGWIALCVLVPILGPMLYFFFGINRVRTLAKRLRPYVEKKMVRQDEWQALKELFMNLPVEAEGCVEIVKISGAVTNRRLVSGNKVDIYHNGEQAYPAMLEAVRNAARSVFLTTYIFDTDRTGRLFIEAMGDAVRRGVDVRVILDGIGELYSWPRARRLLKKKGVQVRRFLPPRMFLPTFHINLRNHRKLLAIDGSTAFVGGMNIGDRHLAEVKENEKRVVDMHFGLRGPVVLSLESVFFQDWAFVTGQYKEDDFQPPEITLPATPPEPQGPAVCRVITDGPNEDLDKLAVVLNSAVAAARKSVFIMTPYFIPPRELMASLQAASLRGIRVIVVLPEVNNLPPVHWATQNLLWELLQWGVEIYYQPAPFVHTKLFLVDGYYFHVGSANIDPRSLRLNFELAVEVYDSQVAAVLEEHVRDVVAKSRRVFLEDVDGRPFHVRLRDSLAWLLSPYL